MQEFYQYIKKKAFFEQHDQVVIALSGGIDSMTLLDFFMAYRDALGVQVILAHVNHHQRAESDKEEEALRTLAETLQLPIYVGHFEGVFSEAAARAFRYSFFEEVMKKTGASALVTAHHINDQAETIVMKLLRGSRFIYLGGMKEVQPFGPGQLIRPFLTFKKSSFTPSLYFEDASNQSMAFQRNRVRHQILPLLEKENPKIVEALAECGQELRDVTEALVELTDGLDLEDLKQFQSYSEALQRVLFVQYLRAFPELEMTRSQVQSVLHVLNKEGTGVYELKHGYELIKDYDRFHIQKIGPQSEETEDELMLYYGDLRKIGPYTLSYGQPLEDASQVLNLPARGPVRIRRRKAGDRILLNGHHRKLKKLFIDRKVPQSKRDDFFIVEQIGMEGRSSEARKRKAKALEASHQASFVSPVDFLRSESHFEADQVRVGMDPDTIAESDMDILAVLDFAISDLSSLLKSDIIESKIYIHKKDR